MTADLITAGAALRSSQGTGGANAVVVEGLTNRSLLGHVADSPDASVPASWAAASPRRWPKPAATWRASTTTDRGCPPEGDDR